MILKKQKTKKVTLANRLFAAFVFTVFTLTTVTTLPAVSYAADAPDVTVTIVKYIDGNPATPENASSTDFMMNATWNAQNIGAGSGQYALSASGFGGDSTPYQAVTAAMTSGADYSTSEVVDGTNVSASCDAGGKFVLQGYTTGDTLEAAAEATPSATVPTFTGITSNKYVVVWNHDCTATSTDPGNGGGTASSTVKVHIASYLDGSAATASSTNSSTFTMHATWSDSQLGSGEGQYTLGPDNSYATDTTDLQVGANYSTNEVFDSTVGSDCTASTTYALDGYSYGNTLNDALTATKTDTAPSFEGLTGDRSVVVWNKSCNGSGNNEGGSGTIGGEVTGGASAGVLAVDSISTINGTATADGTFEHGWKYLFNITIPTNETHLAMKFGNWTLNGDASTTINAANNIRISSHEANNNDATVLVTGADTYTTPTLDITGDRDTNTLGRQVQVLVESLVPQNSVNGSYTTSYGIKTE